MRHLGNVANDRLAGDVLANGKGQAVSHSRTPENRYTPRIKTVLTVLFGTSIPTATLSGIGADTHVRRAERQRNVVRQGGDARDFDAARDGQLEPGDGRSAHDADDLRLDVERVERIEQACRAFAQLGFCARDRVRLPCVSRSIGG